MRSKNSTLYTINRIVATTSKRAPLFTAFIFAIGVLQSLSFVLITFQTERMVDRVSLLSGNSSLIFNAAIQVALLCTITLIAEILNGFQNMLYDIYINRMHLELGSIINQKSNKISPINFEDPDFLDNVEKAKQGMESSIEMILLIGDFVTYYLPYFLFMAVYLYLVRKTFPIFIIAIFMPTLIGQIIRMRAFSDMEDTAAPLRRKMQHYSECVYDTAYIKETRVLNNFFFFSRKFNQTLKLFNRNVKKTRLKTNIIEAGLNCITLTGYLFVLYNLFIALLNKSITIGQFAGVYASISTMFSLMEDAVRYNLSYISENVGFVKNYLSFVDTEEIHISESQEDYSNGILFKQVSFAYPGQEDCAVKDVTFSVCQNETIAIVGENGSGKSTLVNLILGLYSPQSGKIVVGSKERESSVLSYKGKSSVFQRFQKFKLTPVENIVIGNPLSTISDEKVYQVADFSGVLDIVRDNNDIILGTEFSGIDLSVGQWQRFSIARAVYKDFKLITLDEPTASIDPIEEDSLYEKFQVLTKDKTAFIVTHHLGSIRFVDRIIVMEKGKIVEAGTHEELMQQNGLYHKMYIAQASQYN